MKIPFVRLDLQYRCLKKEIDRSIARVFKQARFILGDEVRNFEIEFARYCGVPYAVGVASGTEAIMLAVKALGIQPGDEVITTPVTAFPTLTGILMTGAKPVLGDIGTDFQLDPAKVEEVITRRTKAIVPVHVYGIPNRMDLINRLALRHGLKVIEDAAQAHGSLYKTRHVGTWGDAGCFSFYPTKNLGTYGDGGLVVTRSKKTYEELLLLRDYGRSGRDEFKKVGINSRLDELHAAILRTKLRYLDRWTSERRILASFYNQTLNLDFCTLPEIGKDCLSNYHLYPIRVKNRDGLQRFLEKHGVQTHIHYPLPVYRQKAVGSLHPGLRLPEAERHAKEVLSLPIYPELKKSDILFITNQVNRFFKNHEN